VILENVLGCAHLIDSTSDTVLDHVIMDLNLIGYRVAYRRIRLQDLGLPQLRTRVVILASRTQNPMDVLLAPGTEKKGLQIVH
jgi:site-specific DNA-cytosine methylase